MSQSSHYNRVKSLVIMITLLILAVAGWSWYYTNYVQESEDPSTSVLSGNGEDGERELPQTYSSTEGVEVRLTSLEHSSEDGVLSIEGRAPSDWIFEGSFPLELRAHGGRQPLTESFAESTGETDDGEQIEFRGEIEFETQPEDGEGVLILRRANPSALAENDDEVEIPLSL